MSKAALAVPPSGSKCQERDPSSREDYVACGAPAVMIVEHAGKAGERAGYFMCRDCAGKAIKRGGKAVAQGESYVPVMVTATGPVYKAVPNAQRAEEMLDDDMEAAPVEVSDDKIRLVATLSKTQLELRDQIANVEKHLEGLYGKLKTNMEVDLPEAMSTAGMKDFTLTNGARVEVKKVVRASIPKAHMEEGLDYMDEVAPDLVKHTVTIQFDKKDRSFFNKFCRDLAKRKRPVNADIKRTVHAGTLSAWVRQKDEAGDPWDEHVEEILGVFRNTSAEVKKPS